MSIQKNHYKFTVNGYKLLLITFLFLLIISPIYPSQGYVQSVNQDEKGIILYDESHINQEADYSVSNFASDRSMKDPVKLLRDQGFKVRTNSKEITFDLLNTTIGPRGLLIIALLDDPITVEEGAAIKQWIEAGGSLFTTTQPDYAGFGYSKNENTNDLLKMIDVYDIVHIYSLAGESDEIVDNNPDHRTKLTGNLWDVEITQEQFPDTELGNALKKNIDTVILGTSSLVVTNKSWVGAYAYNESYSQPDGGIDPYDPSSNGLDAIPWIAGGEVGNGGKVLVAGGSFTISGWSLYSTSYKFIEQATNAVLWTNMIAWLMSVEVSIPIIEEKIKIPLIDFLGMAIGAFALIYALTARKDQKRFLRYLLIIGAFGIFSSILGTAQHILYEWQYIGSGLDRFWSLPQDADPVQNAAVRYLFAGLAGPVMITILPVLFIMIARSNRFLGKEFVVNVLNLRVSTPKTKYLGDFEILPLTRRIFAFVVDTVPFIFLFFILYSLTNFEDDANTYLIRELFRSFTEGESDSSAITNIDFIQLILKGSVSLLLIPIQFVIFIIQFTTASLFLVGLLFFLYYFISLKAIGCSVGQRIFGAKAVTDYNGEKLDNKRILLKVIFVMFLDSGFFFLATLRSLSKDENQLKQSYSDKLVRSVVLSKNPKRNT